MVLEVRKLSNINLGGVSTVLEHKYLKKEEGWIIKCYDVNNLYGYAMMQNLPYGDFQFDYIKNTELDELNKRNERLELNLVERPLEEVEWSNLARAREFILGWKNEGVGYILQVDLEYPEELHKKHAKFPVLEEHYAGRLVKTLFDKSKYTCYIANLKFALEKGLILKQIYFVIKFSQCKIFKGYIEFNTKERKKCELIGDALGKNMFKTMNNALYGKMIENALKHKKILIFNKDDYDSVYKNIQKGTFKNYRKLTENSIMVNVNEIPCMDKPSTIGFVILEIAKHR